MNDDLVLMIVKKLSRAIIKVVGGSEALKRFDEEQARYESLTPKQQKIYNQQKKQELINYLQKDDDN